MARLDRYLFVCFLTVSFFESSPKHALHVYIYIYILKFFFIKGHVFFSLRSCNVSSLHWYDTKMRAVSIGHHSKGDDAEKFDKAFEANEQGHKHTLAHKDAYGFLRSMPTVSTNCFSRPTRAVLVPLQEPKRWAPNEGRPTSVI